MSLYVDLYMPKEDLNTKRKKLQKHFLSVVLKTWTYINLPFIMKVFIFKVWICIWSPVFVNEFKTQNRLTEYFAQELQSKSMHFPSSVYSGLCTVIASISPHVSVQEDWSPALCCNSVTENSTFLLQTTEKKIPLDTFKFCICRFYL